MLTNEEIAEKAQWLKDQAEKNRAFMPAFAPLADGNAGGGEADWATLAREYMSRIDEVVIEYVRLAADYIEYRNRVKDRMNSLAKITEEVILEAADQINKLSSEHKRNIESTLRYFGVAETMEEVS